MKKNLLTSTCKASNVFQQKTFRLTQTALSCFLLAIIFLSSPINVRAQATPDASFTITSSTSSAYFTSYPHSTVSTDAGISSASGDFFVSEASTPSGPGANYIDVTAASGYAIDSIAYSLTGNGAAKTLQPAVLGWVNAYDATTADYSFTGVTITVANKGLANATPFSYDLSGKNIIEARLFRAVKNVIVVSPATPKTATIGNAATVQFYGIKVYVSPIVILPVTFTNITAQKTNGTITVSWKTTSQINITGYEVEQSTDGILYSKIGTIAADAGKTNYSLSGINTSATTVHYRVKAIANTGAVTYSTIANITNANTFSGITVYPNPVTGNNISVHLNNLAAGKYLVQLINVKGQQVESTSMNYAGNEIQNIHIPQTAAGIYQLKVSAPNNSVYTKTVLLK